MEDDFLGQVHALQAQEDARAAATLDYALSLIDDHAGRTSSWAAQAEAAWGSIGHGVPASVAAASACSMPAREIDLLLSGHARGGVAFPGPLRASAAPALLAWEWLDTGRREPALDDTIVGTETARCPVESGISSSPSLLAVPVAQLLAVEDSGELQAVPLGMRTASTTDSHAQKMAPVAATRGSLQGSLGDFLLPSSSRLAGASTATSGASPSPAIAGQPLQEEEDEAGVEEDEAGVEWTLEAGEEGLQDAPWPPCAAASTGLHSSGFTAAAAPPASASPPVVSLSSSLSSAVAPPQVRGGHPAGALPTKQQPAAARSAARPAATGSPLNKAKPADGVGLSVTGTSIRRL